jgi:hypothetical protein
VIKWFDSLICQVSLRLIPEASLVGHRVSTRNYRYALVVSCPEDLNNVRQAAVSARSLHTLHEPCLWVCREFARGSRQNGSQTNCIYPGTCCQRFDDVSPGDDPLPRHPLSLCTPRVMPLLVVSILEVRHRESLSPMPWLPRWMTDVESLAFRRRKANNETPPNVNNLLTSQGQATPSVREKASSQPSEGSFIQAGQSKYCSQHRAGLQNAQIAASRVPFLSLLSANRLLDRSSPSVHDYPSINSREPVA